MSDDQQLQEIGRIARLQIQTSSLKCGERRAAYYDPAPLAEAAALIVTRDGAWAEIDGVELVDVHNNLHPASKQRDGINPLSFGFTSHYAMMREQFGDRLVNGIAGENMLVACDDALSMEDVAGGFVVRGEDGREIRFDRVSIAHPCVEFSRFALGDPAADPKRVSGALKLLDGGVRGFYASAVTDDRITIKVGDRVFRAIAGG